MSLRTLRVEYAHRDLRVFRRINAAREIGGERRLFDVGPAHELSRRIARAADLGNGIRIDEKAHDRDLAAVDQPNLTIREHQFLRLRQDFEMLNGSIKALSMAFAKPDFPPDCLGRRGKERRIVRVYRPHRRERDALNARNQSFVFRFASARILVAVLLNLLEEVVRSGIRNKNCRPRR